MYYLAIAAFNQHEAKFGPSKGQMVDNDAYRQVSGGPKTWASAKEQVERLIATSKPGTKIKLVVTVPQPTEKPAAEMSKAELMAKIAELMTAAEKAA
jgi:hypothetical protein